MPITANDFLVDRSIRHSIFLERLKTQQVNSVLRFLDKDVFPAVTEKLRNRLTTITARGFDRSVRSTKRLQDMSVGISELIRSGVRNAGKGLQRDLKAVAVSEAEFQRRLLDSAVRSAGPITVDFLLPAANTLTAVVAQRTFQGATLSDWLSGVSQAAVGRVQRSINTGLVIGESVPNIVRRVRQDVEITRHQAAAIVRTSVNHTVTQARELTYDANSKYISGVQFVATLDARTTEICASLDGRVFRIGEGERPPLHMNCRSTTVPVLKSFSEMGFGRRKVPTSTRASLNGSLNGQVSEKVTYPQWLKRQSIAVQNEALGKGKAELFRQGKLDISKFNGVGNRPLTLAQLQSREG